MRHVCLATLAMLLLSGPMVRPAAAVKQFMQVFFAEYLDNHPDQTYANTVRDDAKCFVCHQGKKRKNRNPFGQALSLRLDRKTDNKDVVKIVAMLQEVAALPADPAAPDGQTFGQRIAASLLPGGELDQLKLNPDELAEQ